MTEEVNVDKCSILQSSLSVSANRPLTVLHVTN